MSAAKAKAKKPAVTESATATPPPIDASAPVFDLAAIEGHARLQFSQADVELMLDLLPGSIGQDKGAARAFARGRLRAQAVARTQLLKQANEGDIKASQLFIKLSADSAVEHQEQDANPQDAETMRQLDLVKAHLLPLGLASEALPIEEHARLASVFIRNAKPAK